MYYSEIRIIYYLKTSKGIPKCINIYMKLWVEVLVNHQQVA